VPDWQRGSERRSLSPVDFKKIRVAVPRRHFFHCRGTVTGDVAQSDERAEAQPPSKPGFKAFGGTRFADSPLERRLLAMPPSTLRIALISEHASPLAAIGGVDAGGQNVYVLNVGKSLARAGHHVDVLTRRDDPAMPAIVDVRPGMRVIQLRAGPPRFIAKEQLLPHMPAFLAAARELMAHSPEFDVIHANFFMSGLVGLRLKELYDLPLAMTFHALGLVRQEHQGPDDGFPPVRAEIERCIVRHADRLIAECPQDEVDLQRLYGARRRPR
jgi:D-inositol-3-phosphate glycosyltransferase